MHLRVQCLRLRFVLGKAVNLGLKPILVINKVDKENCKPDEVQQDVFELMYNLNATDDQLNFETLYGSSKYGWMSLDWTKPNDNIKPLLDTIIKVIDESPYHPGTLQLQVTSLDYSSYVGRIAIGRVFRGDITEGMDYTSVKRPGSRKRLRIKELYGFKGLGREKVSKSGAEIFVP
jgi:GTP-binding protein